MAGNTQQKQIAKFMAEHGWISPAMAWDNFHIMKLSTRISEMIKKGYRIKKERVHEQNAEGKHITYMMYCLDPEPVTIN